MAKFGVCLFMVVSVSACGGGGGAGGSGSSSSTTGLQPGSSSSGSTSSSGTSIPGIASVAPADKDSCVAAADTVTISFTNAMNASSVQTAFHVSNSTGNVMGTVIYASQTATFTPQTPFAANTTYTATLDGSATDTQGNRLGTSYSWTFTTVPAAASGNYILCWNPVNDTRLSQYHIYSDTSSTVTTASRSLATVAADTNGTVPHTYEVAPTTLGAIGSTVYIAVSAESSDTSVNSVLSDSITVQVQ